MKKLMLITVVFMCNLLLLNAQSKKSQDITAIKNMCGCYEVNFDFAETFNYANDSSYVPSAVKHDKGLEWVELVEDSNNKLVLQHLLIVGPPTKQSVIKHWRQDWIFENTDFYMFHADNKWRFATKNPKEVKGQWTQKVYQVDDSPRYEGSATWVHVDGKSYWENTTDAPLPRREYTKRNDYNVTVRTNRHEITPFGWVHDQDNLKVVRNDNGEDFTMAKEKGFNTYTKVDDAKCKAAQDYWMNQQDKWAKVRLKWDEVFNKKTDLVLLPEVDGNPLHRHLFKEDFEPTNQAINEIIDAFVAK
ncbi:hypothetical protein FJ651_03285 [Paucihalobacter ruber]|uniref:Uncharacterized protein n=1 Tax=Paucihalobacter ruber TaxID=2567861 RepID=A0A506PRN9_9FLAO|nr:DUF6607 family protein [Paucihalobacter ruber]TPV35957.1 hypothetical protein FJ651_03285 [Paucihalobacter ruber]